MDAHAERPTLLLLHGGPGFDHSYFKPSHAALVDIAQVVYIDHRGTGAATFRPGQWNLDQWGDDLRAFIEVLGIERPVVLGLSFGGFVAQSFALRHPGHVGKLILASTAAKFRVDRVLEAFGRMHGARAARVAAQFWAMPAIRGRGAYLGIAFPSTIPRRPIGYGIALHLQSGDACAFFRAGGEGYRFDFLPG